MTQLRRIVVLVSETCPLLVVGMTSLVAALAALGVGISNQEPYSGARIDTYAAVLLFILLPGLVLGCALDGLARVVLRRYRDIGPFLFSAATAALLTYAVLSYVLCPCSGVSAALVLITLLIVNGCAIYFAWQTAWPLLRQP